MQTVYIALGSNVGDRAAHIGAALDAMAGYLTVGETSHLYETDPMLVTDQPRFLNAVCRAARVEARSAGSLACGKAHRR